MLKGSIGERAGEVYCYLESNGEATTAKIKKALNLNGDDINLALGWLAREHKININKKKKGKTESLSVSLS